MWVRKEYISLLIVFDRDYCIDVDECEQDIHECRQVINIILTIEK